jgi:hypothetical protein
MISIDNKKLNDEDEDTILMALYHYELIWIKHKNYKIKDARKMIKKINILIDRITKDYPNYDEEKQYAHLRKNITSNRRSINVLVRRT